MHSLINLDLKFSSRHIKILLKKYFRSSTAAATVFFLATFGFYPQAVFAEKIKVLSPDYWCPFGCKANTNFEGYPVEILKAIFEHQGIEIQYANTNYTRAIIEVREGKYTVIPSIFKEEAPDFVFSKATISDSRYCFYTQEGNSWQYKGVESLAGIHIGAIKSYSYGTLIDNAIKSNQANFDLQAGDGLTMRLIRMLMAKRFDTFIENEYLVKYTLTRLPNLHIREAGCEETSKTYIGFSPSNKILAQKYADIFDSGIATLRKNGELTKILAKYGLQDWEKTKVPSHAAKKINDK